MWETYIFFIDIHHQATLHNNSRCGFIGFFWIVGPSLLISYIFVLILNVHFLIVWRKDYLATYGTLVHITIWTLSIAPAIVQFSFGTIETETLGICFTRERILRGVFFIPRSLLVLGAFLIHLHTGLYIVAGPKRWVGKEVGRFEWIKVQVRTQWRSMLLASVSLMNISLVWIYGLMTNGEKVNDVSRSSPWVQAWISCLASHASSPNPQDFCTHIPFQYGVIAHDVFTRLIQFSLFAMGIWCPIIIGSSKALYTDFVDEWLSRFLGSRGGSAAGLVREKGGVELERGSPRYT
ncbi:hypothetical protein HK102_002803 [Quaeritorhiza haematococci]|nr:hypothetical protein HK102_002803 [Quaeritorhiza haematococci]